ncbi:hypothetical protein QBC46DRAFT_273469, partial [Diplogelasinospora grovesii]
NVNMTYLPSLTVGEVAGIISGSLSILSATFPLLVTLILVWIVSSRHLNAVTWSVAGRAFQETSLPLLLNSDGVQRKFVSWPVFVTTSVTTVAAFVLFVAHFLTPLPLSSVIQTDEQTSAVNFTYVPDTGFFGQGTNPRPIRPLSRVCWGNNTNCPGASSLLEILSSGVRGTTIAGPKDIQYRDFLYGPGNGSSNGGQQLTGYFRPIQPVMLESSMRIVEGLVVDAMNGGVGLRNHTVPVGLELGAIWQEDLLWVQPETVCEPTNFTLHFSFPTQNTSYLQDDGAFSNRDWSIPGPRWDIYNSSSLWNVSGPVPNLRQRAHLASWWNNYFTAQALGLSEGSRLSIGDVYSDNFSTYTAFISPFAISISNMDGSYFDASWPANLYRFARLFIDRLGIPISQMVPGVNESRAFQSHFTAYGRRCSGYDDSEPSSSSKPYIRCGNLYGVPVPEDSSTSQRFVYGSSYSQQVYACASSVKASIKTVEFKLNGTASLTNLTVSGIFDKTYSSPEREPLWGVERVDSATELTIQNIDVLWGLVDGDYANHSGIELRRGKELYLPATSQTNIFDFRDNLAAATAFTAAWNNVYLFASWIAGTSIAGLPSYSGESQYALFLKWLDLSSSPGGALQILNLIWTDLVASAIVGTKTGFESNGSIKALATGDHANGTRPVHIHRSAITYSNLLFAIPAFVAAAMWVTALVLAAVLLLSHTVTRRMISHYMNQTSLGRAILNAANPGLAVATAPTSKWLSEAGDIKVDIPHFPGKPSSPLPNIAPAQPEPNTRERVDYHGNMGYPSSIRTGNAYNSQQC